MDDLRSLPALPLDTSRTLAILADLHANIEALEVVVAWLDERGVTNALVLGDLVGYGASPREVVDLVRERGWTAVRGNHEDMLLDSSHVERTRSLKSSARKALAWTRSRLGAGALEYFESLPLAARAGDDLFAVHGSLVDPRHCYAYIYEFSLDLNARRLRELDPPPGAIVCFGHTHHPALFSITSGDPVHVELGTSPVALANEARHLLNPGSVGFPRDRDARAAFAVYEPASRRLEPVRLAYDVEAAAEKIRRAGYDTGLAERLLAAR